MSKTRSRETPLSKWRDWLRARGVLTVPDDDPQAHPDSLKLIHRLDVFVDAQCPCGSAHIHRLTLATTSECRRCGRTLAIRAIQFFREKYGAMPQPIVSVGYVQLDETLAKRQTTGVH